MTKHLHILAILIYDWIWIVWKVGGPKHR